MKKGVYITQLIRNIIVLIILFWLLSNNSGLICFMMIPFIICICLSIVKNICLIIGQDKYAYIFNKLYIIVFLSFAFCFLIFWSYTVMKAKNYINLLFTIPFWLMGIYFIRKSFFPKSQKSLSHKKESIFNMKIIVSCFLVSAILISGFLCLFIGIHDTYQLNQKTNNYVMTEGTLIDYKVYNVDEDGTTYQLIYEYTVDSQKYTVSTDYGVENVLDVNSTRQVKYDPDNYENAVLVGTNRNNGLIYFGAFFVFCGMIFVLAFLQMKGVFDKVKFDVVGTFIGVILTVIGIGSILLQNGMTSSFIETVQMMGLWICIPIMFMIVGILLTIRSLFLHSIKRK